MSSPLRLPDDHSVPVAHPDNLVGVCVWQFGEVSSIFTSLLEVARIVGKRVEKVEMVSVAAASAKTTD